MKGFQKDIILKEPCKSQIREFRSKAYFIIIQLIILLPIQ